MSRNTRSRSTEPRTTASPRAQQAAEPVAAPQPTPFSEFDLPKGLVDSLAGRGITETFNIQTLALPPALAGQDVCGKAPTGSGKTLAFGIPVAQRVKRARPGRPRALILTPTRELAAQIREELLPLLPSNQQSVATFYGGVGFGPQLRALRQGVEIAVACPGRLSDLINRGNFKLDDVEIVVIDEADRMADMGFLPEVRRILDKVRPDRQTLLFSATLDGDVDVLIRNYQNDPVICEVVADEEHEDRTTHRFVRTNREDRLGLTAELANEHGSTVVFCRTKHGTDRVAKQLQRAGVTAVPIHGGRSQSQRDRALAAFSDQRSQVLVATDVAARGIHVDDVGLVIHYDVPGDHKDYVHRSGRTGRAGAEGLVVSLVTDADVSKVREMQKELDLPLLKMPAGTGGGAGGSGRSSGSGSRNQGGRSGAGGRGRSGSGRRSGSRGRSAGGRGKSRGGRGGTGSPSGRHRSSAR